MAKWRINSYNSGHYATGEYEVEVSSEQEAREAADQVESETGAAFTTIAKESSEWGFVAQPRR